MTDATHAPPLARPQALLVDFAAGLVAIVVSFVAIAAADAGAGYAPALWTAVPFVFFAVALALGWAHGDYARRGRALLLRDAAHWGATLAALLIHRGFVEDGAVAGYGEGVADGVLLGLASVLAGVHGHVRLLPVGLAVFAACYSVVFLEDHLWAMVALAVCALIASIVLGRRQIRRARGQDARP